MTSNSATDNNSLKSKFNSINYFTRMEIILLVGAFAVVVVTQKVIQAEKTGCTANKVIVDHRLYESIAAENHRKYSSRYNSSRLQAAENQKEVVQNEALSKANRTINLIQQMFTKIQTDLGQTKRTTVAILMKTLIGKRTHKKRCFLIALSMRCQKRLFTTTIVEIQINLIRDAVTSAG